VRMDVRVARFAQEGIPYQHERLRHQQEDAITARAVKICPITAGTVGSTTVASSVSLPGSQTAAAAQPSRIRLPQPRWLKSGTVTDTAQPAQIARAGGMVDDTGDEEQGAFIQAMRQHANHKGFEGDLGILPEQHHQHAQLADGGIGQQTLEIVLLEAQVSSR
jgi:hypothetical protein